MKNDFAGVVRSRAKSIDTIEVGQINALRCRTKNLLPSFSMNLVGGCNSKNNRWPLAVCPAVRYSRSQRNQVPFATRYLSFPPRTRVIR